MIVNPRNGPSNRDHDTQTSEESDTYCSHFIVALLKPRPCDICVIQYRCYVLLETHPSVSSGRHHFERDLAAIHNQLAAFTTGFVGDDDDIPIDAAMAKDMLKVHRGIPRPPQEFEVGAGSIIQGLEAAVQRIVPHGKEKDVLYYEVTIPYNYVYDHKGHLPEIPPKANLMFNIKLAEVEYTGRIISQNAGNGVVQAIRQMVLGFVLSLIWPWSARPQANRMGNNND